MLDKKQEKLSRENKVKLYVYGNWGMAIIISILIGILFSININKGVQISPAVSSILSIILAIIVLIPIESIIVKIVQYILSKTVKPKIVPKLDFQNGIPEEYSTMVIIPTIVNSKEKVIELFKKIEVYYLANKEEKLYFTLLRRLHIIKK